MQRSRKPFSHAMLRVVTRHRCDGCHEHTRANMQAKHREEGVSESTDNCVRCHHIASGEEQGKGSREGEGNRQRSQGD